MNKIEKQLRYQGTQQLARMEREGAKPNLIERVRRSIAGTREHVQKGKVFGPKGKGF